MVQEFFKMARKKKPAIVFDEMDAFEGACFEDGAEGDNEVQRMILKLINQLGSFAPRGNIKGLMGTTRLDTSDPALTRPGRRGRKTAFSLPDLEGQTHIFKIRAHVRFELLA